MFIATLNDGAQDITVRAKSVAEVREQVAVELARPLGTPKIGPREPIGGASSNKVRYEIDWLDPTAGTTVRVRITHSRDYLSQPPHEFEIAVGRRSGQIIRRAPRNADDFRLLRNAQLVITVDHRFERQCRPGRKTAAAARGANDV